ncbi:hypothetical protein Taro_003274 [Colocasia esculenta]|uniref:Fungal lipase-type domain-containing protein n=1 Tax=Colocasia esculenta TaxID=4460 RepID=A0A843TIR7_COLES|nr:hypothetical protein [Colocasia esculenta]
MAREGEFFSDYMVLHPEEGGILDLIHLLRSCNIHESRCIEYWPNGRTEKLGFRRRWFVVVSLAVQKMLFLCRRPVDWFGSRVEFLANLLSHNHGLVALARSWLRGKKVIIPDKKSASYRSTIGLLDDREGLVKAISPEDSRYPAALTVMASKLAYENEARIKDIVQSQWEHQYSTTQAFMFSDKHPDQQELITVAFRGTETFNAIDWAVDLDFSWFAIPGAGKAHGGFMKALGLQQQGGWPKDIPDPERRRCFAYYAVRERLAEALRRRPEARFLVTGHSLGGALAVLFLAVLALHQESWMLERLEGVYTYGQPKVGDKSFGRFVSEHLDRPHKRYYRFVYGSDIVPGMPWDVCPFLFEHFGTCLHYDSLYWGTVIVEERRKKRAWPVSMVAAYVNAIWEVGRSFVIGNVKGPEFREGWGVMVMRLTGLLVPGLPAHNPRDYVNSVMLGNLLIDDSDHED